MDQHTYSAWSSRMTELQNAYEVQFEQLEGDIEGRLAAQAYLNDSDARYHGEIIGMGFLPKPYDEPALHAFDSLVSNTYSILDKMTRHFIDDAKYRALFRLSPLLERMILLPDPYECTIPICRIDIFLDENDGSFKFCEINTDGTSAMNEDREISDALALTPTLKGFAAHHDVKSQELFDTWVKTFMDIYEKSVNPVPDPLVAIIDYLDSAVIEEQLEFRTRFAHYGVNCLVVDVSTLEYRDGALYGRDISKQHPAYTLPLRIDAVYRRAVTFELLQELEETPLEAENILSSEHDHNTPLRGALALLAAVSQQKVCMLGGFKTQVAHSKACFCLMHHPKTQEFLTAEEQLFVQDHVPYTTWLRPECIDIDLVKSERERWIIKPVDGYASQGVQAGKSLNNEEWSRLIEEKLQEDYIAQEYCPQFQTLNTIPVPKDERGRLVFDDAESAREFEEQDLFFSSDDLKPYNILTGLYCYGGRFSGIYIRSGPDDIIVGHRGGITLASLLVNFQPTPTLCIQPRTILD